MTTLTARFDGEVLIPQEPLTLNRDEVVNIRIERREVTSLPDRDSRPLLGLVEIANQFPDDPDLPVDLAAQHDHSLHDTPKCLDAENVAQSLKSLSEEISKIVANYPDDPDTPTDYAAQHRHYRYGTPKRP